MMSLMIEFIESNRGGGESSSVKAASPTSSSDKMNANEKTSTAFSGAALIAGPSDAVISNHWLIRSVQHAAILGCVSGCLMA
jgi:hypothetical protein